MNKFNVALIIFISILWLQAGYGEIEKPYRVAGAKLIFDNFLKISNLKEEDVAPESKWNEKDSQWSWSGNKNWFFGNTEEECPEITWKLWGLEPETEYEIIAAGNGDKGSKYAYSLNKKDWNEDLHTGSPIKIGKAKSNKNGEIILYSHHIPQSWMRLGPLELKPIKKRQVFSYQISQKTGGLMKGSRLRYIEDFESIAYWRSIVHSNLQDKSYLETPGILYLKSAQNIRKRIDIVDIDNYPVLEMKILETKGKWSVTIVFRNNNGVATTVVFQADDSLQPGVHRVNYKTLSKQSGIITGILLYIKTERDASVKMEYLRLCEDTPQVPVVSEVEFNKINRKAVLAGDGASYKLTLAINAKKETKGILDLNAKDKNGSAVMLKKEPMTLVLKEGKNTIDFSYSLNKKYIWDPDNPVRIIGTLTFTSQGGKVFTKELKLGQPVLEIKGDKLFVNGRQFLSKGMGYSPREGRWQQQKRKEVLETDFKDMKKLGINTIKQWGMAPSDFVDMAEEYGMFIIEGLGGEYEYPSSRHSHYIAMKKEELIELLEMHKESPSVLVESFGWEYWGEGADDYIVDFVEEMHKTSKEYAPEILTTYAGIPNVIGWQLPVDIGSIQIYRGHNTQVLKDDLMKYKTNLKGKPVLVTEFGHSSNYAKPSVHRRAWQAEGYQMEWNTMVECGVIGGVVFMWDDRGMPGQQKDGDPEYFFGIRDVKENPKMSFFFVGEMFGGLKLLEKPQKIVYPDSPVITGADSKLNRILMRDLNIVTGGVIKYDVDITQDDLKENLLLIDDGNNKVVAKLEGFKKPVLKTGEGTIKILNNPWNAKNKIILFSGGDDYGAGLAVEKYIYEGRDSSVKTATGAPIVVEAEKYPGKMAETESSKEGASKGCVKISKQWAGVDFIGITALAVKNYEEFRKVYLWLRVNFNNSSASFFVNRKLDRWYPLRGDGSADWQWIQLKHATGPGQEDGFVWTSEDIDFSFYLSQESPESVYVDQLLITPDALFKP